ncbi:MAG: damage-inducible protein DinB [Paenibacillaceae bacterium]|jgi:uncharacterized damage-inducible protein DinB|nr:damage-inducible protein DinB [Paenibacillaceae bacterium]
MTAVQELQHMLFEELELIVRTTANLLAKVKPDDLEFRPQPNMRTLRELAEHLAAVPAVDLLILQEHPAGEVRTLEGRFAETAFAMLGASMADGLGALRQYMSSLTEDDFLHRKTAPFYMDHGTAQAKWLIEIVTHAQHHRAQLFTYLKMQGYEVSMSDLY